VLVMPAIAGVVERIFIFDVSNYRAALSVVSRMSFSPSSCFILVIRQHSRLYPRVLYATKTVTAQAPKKKAAARTKGNPSHWLFSHPSAKEKAQFNTTAPAADPTPSATATIVNKMATWSLATKPARTACKAGLALHPSVDTRIPAAVSDAVESRGIRTRDK
jgi:hypothetical protein